MKNLYQLQTLLVVIFSLLSTAWTYGQISSPKVIHLKSSGSSYSDQFEASTGYTYGILQDVSPQLGLASISVGSGSNTLKVMFTPNPGVTGTTNLIVTYYSLSAPVHPVTRSYLFYVAPEIVIPGDDQFVVDKGGVNIPLTVLENDSATSGTLDISTVSVLNTGAASINATGDTILFTPDADFEGDSWLQYIACDTSGHCAQGNIHVLVRDPDLQDQLTFQKYLLNREELLILTPFPGFVIDNEPASGSLDSTGTSSWVYTPDEDFTGNDTFQLGLAGLVTRQYIVTVYEKEYNVQALDDKFYVRPGLSVSFNVLNNDLLEFDIVSNTNPTKGVLFDIGNGAFTYTPNTGFRGVDKFTYTSCFEDTVYCETATVYLHVTDLEPENTFTYKLQTSEDLPLTMDYPIAYTDFSYITSVQPAHGTFTFHEGLQTISLPCDTIESYNMLVYTPDAGYTGPDHFEYYYCIVPSNICYLVKVDMTVIEQPEPETCPCVVDCVWPGDADLDGRVDMSDLLAIGHRLGETGTMRAYTEPETWFGQHAETWNFSGNGQGMQYLDANGDGAITGSDVDIISNHYYRSHDIVVKDVQQKLPYQFSLIPVQFSLDSGDVVILDVALGNANLPVLDLKGTKFTVNIPPAWIDSSSVQVDFHQDSWLAEGSPFIALGKVPWDGRIDAGYVRANGNAVSGFGVVATIVFIIEEDIEGFKTGDGPIQIPVTLQSGVVMGPDGTFYDVEGDEIILTYDPRGKKNTYSLHLFPNPAQDVVNVHVNGKTEIQSVEVFDMQGRAMSVPQAIFGKRAILQTDGLASGMYVVRTQHTHGVLTETVSVVR